MPKWPGVGERCLALDEVVLVRGYRHSHHEGLVKALTGAAIIGRLYGMTEDCVGDNADAPIGGLGLGTAYRLLGAIVGGIDGSRQRVNWRE